MLRPINKAIIKDIFQNKVTSTNTLASVACACLMQKSTLCKPKGFDSILSCSCLERQVYIEVYVICRCPDFTHISSFRLFKKMKLAKK